MLLRRVVPILALVAFLVTIGVAPASGQREVGEVVGFSVLHVTDMHIDPHLARSGPPGPLRGGETIEWVCQEAAKAQDVVPFELTAPPPTFALATGDLTEYGVIDDTWEVFERAFHRLPCPLNVLPGNHDNTWVAMYEVMRREHGGENYSFDAEGCHFVCISSASPQEPVPTIDAKTRAWLKANLESTRPGTPIFVALHHPPYSNEFANPAELDTLLDLLRDYNVVLLLYGHGHAVSTREIGGIPGVMGGATFGKNAGYGLLSVQDRRVRYAYRYHRGVPGAGEQRPTWKGLVDFPLSRKAKPRLLDIRRLEQDAVVSSDKLGVELVAPAGLPVSDVSVTFMVNGEVCATREGAGSFQPVELDCQDLVAGAHLLSVHAKRPDGPSDVRTRTFLVEHPGIAVVWRQAFPAAIKAGPVVVGDLLIVARNDGVVTALDRHSGRERWRFNTGGEILGTPACSGELLVFGSGDGKVYALNRDGKRRWAFDAGLPVYGWPLIAGDTVFIGDNGGRMYALKLADGKPRWTFARADYGIESRPVLWDDLVVFGAWDGYLYAVGRDDGKLRWKVWGPKSSEGKAARYYAPADCGPVVVGDNLFVCDRGYQLGMYSRDGKLVSKWPRKISAISPDAAGRSLFGRTTDGAVCRFDARGETRWKVDVPAGRFPVPPTVCDGRVYVCSNRGRLSVLDTRDGAVLWSYQATPGFYVMAPVTVDNEHICYVAGMDGSLTAVRWRGQ
jgi:outer membrane protein assembly factor BamB